MSTSDKELKYQVEVIRQAFSYVNQFRGALFVIKIDSPLIFHPYFPALVRDLALLHRLGIRIVLVPGARERISEILLQYEIPWELCDGVRICSEESIPFIKMAAFDVSNRLMTHLSENQTEAVIGNWVRARGIGIRHGVDFKCAGIVDRVLTETVQRILDQGMVPIFPNIGWNKEGKPYNISSDELASRLSQDLKAEKLFFVGSSLVISPKHHRPPEQLEYVTEDRVPRLTVDEAEDFLKLNRGDEHSDLMRLVALGHESCLHGVKRVHLVDGEVEGVILKEIFSNEGVGTMIYANEHINIRPLVHTDIPEVLRIMQPLVEREMLVPRSEALLVERADDFVVYEVDNNVHACGALHVWAQDSGEIAALAVDETYAGMGIGKKIVYFLLQRARRMKLKVVFVLTTQTSDWFSQLGFHRGNVDRLPRARQELYDRRRGSAVFYREFPVSDSTR